MLLCHHEEGVARTSDTSALSQFSLPAREREQVEAQGYGSFLGPRSAFVRAGSARAVCAASQFVSAAVNRGSSRCEKCSQHLLM